MKPILIIFAGICLLWACTQTQPRKITVYTVGDSTMANKDTTLRNPERGWAMMFQPFFDTTMVIVENHAVNGRSSKSFMDEGKWQVVADKLQAGDYVFIQFGHNDEKSEDPKRYTDPQTTYKEFLTQYVNETRAKGAFPVLMTSIARRKFSPETGMPLDTHGEYPVAVRELAKELDVPLIDMAVMTERMLIRMGHEDSKRIYMWLQSGQSPKFPDGLQDDTHLNEYGAFQVAQMVAGSIRAQQLPLAEYLVRNINEMGWGQVVRSQPDDWYGTPEAIAIAENVLLYQRNSGGWPKNTPMHQKLSDNDKKTILAEKDKDDSTIDNDATQMEMIYLAKVYNATANEIYRDAVIRGLNYIFESQYANGGWPQFYPLHEGYYTHITYNDYAMVNVMNLIKSISRSEKPFGFINDEATLNRCTEAFNRGVDCILKTQYRQNGVLTVWCAQHDAHTLEPAKARTYELPSLSGSESAGIVRLLKGIENPSPEVTQAIDAAMAWFEKVKITGIRVENYVNEEGKRDRHVVADDAASPLWARFYTLEDNRPFFCDRDGVKKYELSEIGYERRNGYSWYTDAPQRLFDKND
ncbi:MAG: pectate lyase [Bacteroidales bacterium]|jgi:PelA/Pel-15E family pectate lyase|nr:pectate lyase [Bacteroidales bacterium]